MKTFGEHIAEAVKTGKDALADLLKSYEDEYLKVSADRAKKFIDSKLKDLAAVDWDLDKIAPYPSTVKRNYEGEYKEALALHNLYQDITTYVTPTRTMNEPNLRKKDAGKEAKFIQTSVKISKSNYDAFIAKMKQKIGKEVVRAELKGSIWSDAVITVETVDGETQNWKTQIIINYSKYNKAFNQFPTRKAK